MIYIENIFICLAIPMMVSLVFIRGDSRRFSIFVILGMGVCLLSAYVSSFFMGYYGVDTTVAAIEITPVFEEVMKLLPLVFYFLILEPEPEELPAMAIAIAVGFATFENVCYLTENGAENFSFLLIRGFSAGALRILCGIFSGFGISYVFRFPWLMFTGTVGLLGICIGFHGIYNLLITAEGSWQVMGYHFPFFLILFLYVLRKGRAVYVRRQKM